MTDSAASHEGVTTPPRGDLSGEKDHVAPIRICCGRRHYGPTCMDGLTMCCICFKRVPRERLNALEVGDGVDVSSAPILEDACRTCRLRETRWSDR